MMVKADKKIVHEKHVAGGNALCFDCHEPIRHRQVVEFDRPVLENCAICHPDHHLYQKKLLAGRMIEKAQGRPGLMSSVRTNCLGCHIELSHDKKGQGVKRASGRACVSCHSEGHYQMLKEWQNKLLVEIEAARVFEKEAQVIIEKAKGSVPDEKIAEAVKMLKEGQENLRTVEYGNGIHNKKYSIILIDSALNSFEDIIDYLTEGS
jgi:hypothetical protein